MELTTRAGEDCLVIGERAAEPRSYDVVGMGRHLRRNRQRQGRRLGVAVVVAVQVEPQAPLLSRVTVPAAASSRSTTGASVIAPGAPARGRQDRQAMRGRPGGGHVRLGRGAVREHRGSGTHGQTRRSACRPRSSRPARHASSRGQLILAEAQGQVPGLPGVQATTTIADLAPGRRRSHPRMGAVGLLHPVGARRLLRRRHLGEDPIPPRFSFRPPRRCQKLA